MGDPDPVKSKESLTAGLNGCSYAFLTFQDRVASNPVPPDGGSDGPGLRRACAAAGLTRSLPAATAGRAEGNRGGQTGLPPCRGHCTQENEAPLVRPFSYNGELIRFVKARLGIRLERGAFIRTSSAQMYVWHVTDVVRPL